MTTAQTIDPDKLNALMGKMLGDLGAAMGAPLALLGDRLGLYKAMAGAGPLSASDVSERTNVRERYVREWLNAQAAAGYVDYDAGTGRYTLSPEQAAVFADDESPFNMQGAFEILSSVHHDEAKIANAYRTGMGLGWHEHHANLFHGTERFFRPGYNVNLVSSWLPALDGVVEKLKRGGKAADVGCGHGASTILMAQAFPASVFHGFDYHGPSIDVAAKRAQEAGVGERTRFERAHAKDFPARDYDLVAFFDCLHDMGDPVGAARHVKETLAKDGTWLIVEPYANDRTEDNLNPVGRIFYSASAVICTPASLSQEVGLGLGAQAGEQRIRDVVMEAGFTRFRRAAETPFNLILEARP